MDAAGDVMIAMATSLFSIRKILNRPRLDDWAPLAKMYHADEALCLVTEELDALDSRREPERCNRLVNKLRHCQDRVLQAVEEMLCTVFPESVERAPRDYRVKFPDDVINDSLPGQLWFGAECLATGSNIIDHECESEAIRPLARTLTRHIDRLRAMCKEQAIRDPHAYPDKLKQSLRTFDYLLAEFELNYVSAMVPVKTTREYERQQEVAVLFSETLSRAVSVGYLTQDQIDYCDPCVMVVLPRLAIVTGLVVYPDGPLRADQPEEHFCGMFKTFYSLLSKLRELLLVLSAGELEQLERMLSSSGEEGDDAAVPPPSAGADCARRSSSASDIPAAGGRCGDRPQAASPESLQEHAATVPHNMQSAGGQSKADAASNNGSDSLVFSVPICAGDAPAGDVGAAAPAECDGDGAWLHKRAAVLRGRFRSPADLIHRLFVCISGVADQLQVNFPSDLRLVLRAVLQSAEMGADVREVNGHTAAVQHDDDETAVEADETGETGPVRAHRPLPPGFPDGNAPVGPPVVRWVPDSECAVCTTCSAPFTLTRRRHHCRNCGRIYCGACSAHALPLPELGYETRVRVCNQCFVFRVNHFDGFAANAASGTAAAANVEGGGAPSTSAAGVQLGRPASSAT